MNEKSPIDKKSNNIRWDIRLLVGTGIFLALIAAFLPETKSKSFTLLSTTSSSLIGAGIGILKEERRNLEEDEKDIALGRGVRMATPPVGSPEVYSEDKLIEEY